MSLVIIQNGVIVSSLQTPYIRGNSNTYIGKDAGDKTTTGAGNVFAGEWAGYDNTTGYSDVFIGLQAGYNNEGGFDNVFIGREAGLSSVSGNNNVFVGRSAGYANTGYGNVFLGRNAGVTNITGANNTYLGREADGLTDALTNAIAIGYNTKASLSNSWQVGILGTKQVIKEGANAAMGTATLVAGTIIVSNTLVTANSRIFLTVQSPGGTPGFVYVSARTAGTSFTILSSNAGDTSIVAWEIKEPA